MYGNPEIEPATSCVDRPGKKNLRVFVTVSVFGT